MTIRTDAIRKVLDLMDANPGVLQEAVESEYGFQSKTASIGFHDRGLDIHLPSAWTDENRAAQKILVRQIIRAFGGTWKKQDSGSTMYFRREGIFGYFEATIYADRAAVCERVVTGTKTVEHARVEAVKAYKETVDVVKWECKSLLADEPAKKELVNA
ncbi:hypothetical protein [Frigoribacterium sp. UYMn621]|uniref:hypothetical protein n=1 Tax=Frigoribacterium sp. UYMn621 TaxID=3156343 RepID=UPI0033910827